MMKLNSRILSAFMALLLVISLLSGITFTANSATVEYKYASTTQYSNVSNIIINWGTREEVATFLSPKAEAFYDNTTYEELVVLSGSSNLDNVHTSALYVELYNLMDSAHTKETKYDETRDMYQYTDCQNNGAVSAKISAFYSGEAVGPAWDKGSTWNREHVWPNSKGGDKDNNGGGVNETDIMMLRPETQSNNSSRGNKAFGESSGYYYPNLSSTYDVRGDVARVVLYTYVRWGTEESEVLNNLWGSDGVFESLDIMLKWIEEDPVDTWEMGRNDSVQSITGTRNVFVDYPELAFELFNEEIPEMTTPSGNAAGEVPCSHSYQYEEVAPTLSAGGYTREYCVLCGEETIEDEIAPLTNMEGWNLTLADDVSVNFKINVDDSIRSSAKIHMTVAGTTTVYPVSELTADTDESYYLTVKLKAYQMTDEISVQITNGTDQTEKKSYTVKAYAETLLAGDYTTATKTLVTQMLHYGAAAQTYFDYKTETLANAGLTAAAQETPKAANAYTKSGELEGIDFHGATLLFRDRIAVRYYFTVTSDVSAYTFTANGSTYTPQKKGNYYYIEVADINPQDLNNSITVKVNDTLTVNYSPMNYVVNMRSSGSEKLQALVQALYDYYLAAKTYTNS